MDQRIAYNPSVVGDFATDVVSRAGQLEALHDETAKLTNALQEFFETPAEARAALDGLSTPMALTYITSRLTGYESRVHVPRPPRSDAADFPGYAAWNAKQQAGSYSMGSAR